MTVESNSVIAIATLSDWLKRLAPVFQPMRRKTKTNCTMYAWSSELHVIARNCDWFIALPAPVVIGRSNFFAFWFFDSHLKTALCMSCFVNSLLSFYRLVNKMQQVEAGEDFIFLIHLFFLLLIFSFFFYREFRRSELGSTCTRKCWWTNRRGKGKDHRRRENRSQWSRQEGNEYY